MTDRDAMKAVAVVCLASVFAMGSMGAARSKKIPIEQQIDEIFAPVTQKDAPGLAVLVRKDGRTIFESGYGVRDLRTNAPIDARTNFRLASFAKQFTVAAIMLLVRDGKLRYEQTLTELIPGFPAYGKTITVRNLLNHTSGLPDYEDLMEAAEKTRGPLWSAEHQIQNDEVLELLEKETRGKFPAGQEWSYSNSGYVVLGTLIGRISGQPYDEFLRGRIFTPLHMDHTIVLEKGKNEVVNRAYGHSKEKDAFVETDQSATSATLGDGGAFYSNLEDLTKWDDALRNHTLLTAAEMEPALTPGTLNGGRQTVRPQESEGEKDPHAGEPVSYGFGWFLDLYRSHLRMWHSGSSMGFRTVIDRFTKENRTIIILSNRTDLDPESLALRVADTFFARL